MAELPSVENVADNYYADGLRVIGTTHFASNAWVKSYFQNNGIDHLYNFDSNVANSFWLTTNNGGNEPWKLVLDRDGNIRMSVGSGNYGALAAQCLGVS